MTTKDQTIPKGYKHTEVGVIPSDWDVKQLGDLFEITSSKRVFQSDWKSIGVPFYRARELAVLGEIGAVDNELFITSELYRSFRNAYGVPKVGDILVTGVGTLGKVFVVKDESEFYFKDGNIIWLKINKKIDSNFLKQLYLTRLVKKQIEDASAGTTVGTYTITGAKKTTIPYPKSEEQTAIATALSDTDALIEKLTKLIEKKKNIKQGAMQELLTGKRRLPGFSEKWETKELVEIANFYDNFRVPVTESKREFGLTPYYGANGIQGYIKGHTHNGEFILIAEDGANDLNNYPVLYVNGKVWVNNHAHVIQGIDGRIKTKYLSYALKTVNFVQVLVGGTRAKLNGSVAKAIKILIPLDTAEQSAIASVLSDMDTEIERLESQLSKYQNLKQGMMQTLLTGKIRLI